MDEVLQNYLDRASTYTLGACKVRPRHFGIAVDWVYSVYCLYGGDPKDPDIFLSACRILNNYYLFQPTRGTDKLQLTVLSCLYLAIHVRGNSKLDSGTLAKCNPLITLEQIKTTATEIMTTLGGDLVVVDAYVILEALRGHTTLNLESAATVVTALSMFSTTYGLRQDLLAAGVYYYLSPNATDLPSLPKRYSVVYVWKYVSYVAECVRKISIGSLLPSLKQDLVAIVAQYDTYVAECVRKISIGSLLPSLITDLVAIVAQYSPQDPIITVPQIRTVLPTTDNISIARVMTKEATVVGQGGYGSVFKNDNYAYKQQRWSDGITEVAIMRSLRHPNVETVLAFGFPSSQWSSIQMHYRTPLGHLMDTGALTPDSRFSVMKQILEALTYIHSSGVIHRDIKPDNFLMDDDTVKLADFGVAACLIRGIHDRSRKWRQTACGLYYRDPNLTFGIGVLNDPFEFLNYSCEVDVWAAGITFVELETGKRLSNDPRVQAVIGINSYEIEENYGNYIVKQIISGELLRGLPPKLHNLLTKMLELSRYTRITARDALAMWT
jgi:hypothetical protein